ncbi:hypothetical protein B7486_61170, partial [cyanobacterium TDX16]
MGRCPELRRAQVRRGAPLLHRERTLPGGARPRRRLPARRGARHRRQHGVPVRGAAHVRAAPAGAAAGSTG